MTDTTIYDCPLIYLPRIDTGKGFISVVDNGRGALPFEVKRSFYLYDIPGGKSRGAHAHKTCHQFIVAASGAFDILLDDGHDRRPIQLNRPYTGLHVPPGIWASEANFSSGSICLILTSHEYDPEDYIRDYEVFKQCKNNGTMDLPRTFIHEKADVKTVHVGEGTRIWQYAVVEEGARIGRNCRISCHTFIEGDVRLGDNVTVKSGVYLWNGLLVGDDVFIGPNVTFTNDKYPRSGKRPPAFQQTILQKGCSLGAGSVILGGITVGAHALVGAGSVVTRDVPPYALVMGNPAVVTGRVDEEGRR